MTPYERMIAEKDKVCCTNCKYLYQNPCENTTEGTNHVNYCKKSGKILLEMHIDVPNIFRDCFERRENRMSNVRLIDAERFKKQIAGMAIVNNYPPEKANTICELIDAQPTAYDVEETIIGVQALIKPFLNESKKECALNGIEKIIKAGGKQ